MAPHHPDLREELTQEIEAALGSRGRPCGQASVEAILEKLVAAARFASTRTTTAPGESITEGAAAQAAQDNAIAAQSGSTPVAGDVLELAVLILVRANELKISLVDSGTDALKAIALGVLPTHLLVQEIAEWDRQRSGTGPRLTFDQRCEFAGRFAAAILPHPIQRALKDKANLANRFAAFDHWSRAGAVAFAAHMAKILSAEGSAQPARDATEMIARVPADRLTTWDDDNLRRFAREFLHWRLVVAFIEETLPRGRDTEAAQDMLGRLCQQIAQLINTRRELTQRADEISAGDVYALLQERISAYTYEGGLFAWLVMVVTNHFLDGRRTTLPAAVLGDWIGESTDDPPEFDAVERAFELSLRFELVVRTFEKEKQPLVRLIFERMLLAGLDEGEKPPKDSVLAEQFARHLGGNVDPEEIGRYRFKLRRRLAVLRFLLDIDPGGKWDAPGDGSVMAFINGQPAGETQVLRRIAALGRVARSSGTFLWPLGALLLWDAGLTLDEAADILGPHFSEERGEAFRAAAERTVSRTEVIDDVSNKLRRNKLAFLASAVISLKFLLESPDEAVVRVLNPDKKGEYSEWARLWQSLS